MAEFQRVWNTFTNIGNYQYSEDLTIEKSGKVSITTMIQENYDGRERKTVTISKESAIAAARAILRHYDVGVE